MFKEWGNCVKDGAATISCIPIIFLNIVSALFIFTGLVALAMFIAGGFKLMNSAGDPKKIESAKNSFTYAIIGISITFASFLIIRVISGITGVECIKYFNFACQ